MTIQDLHETMINLSQSTSIEVIGYDTLYWYTLCDGQLKDIPFDIYSKANVVAFNPDSTPMRFVVKFKEN